MVSGQTPASAGCRSGCGIFNEGLSRSMFVTCAAHLVNTPPTHSVDLPLLDTCCCSWFAMTQERRINKDHKNLMRKGKEHILPCFITEAWQHCALCLWWLLSVKATSVIMDMFYSAVYIPHIQNRSSCSTMSRQRLVVTFLTNLTTNRKALGIANMQVEAKVMSDVSKWWLQDRWASQALT